MVVTPTCDRLCAVVIDFFECERPFAMLTGRELALILLTLWSYTSVSSCAVLLQPVTSARQVVN